MPRESSKRGWVAPTVAHSRAKVESNRKQGRRACPRVKSDRLMAPVSRSAAAARSPAPLPLQLPLPLLPLPLLPRPVSLSLSLPARSTSTSRPARRTPRPPKPSPLRSSLQMVMGVRASV
jgi:hypothetical protein